MIKISKNLRNYLVENGVRCGENGISKTHSNDTTYYLCESERNMLLVDKYNEMVCKSIVKTK